MKIEPAKTHIAKELKHTSPLVSCRFDPSGKYIFLERKIVVSGVGILLPMPRWNWLATTVGFAGWPFIQRVTRWSRVVMTAS